MAKVETVELKFNEDQMQELLTAIKSVNRPSMISRVKSLAFNKIFVVATIAGYLYLSGNPLNFNKIKREVLQYEAETGKIVVQDSEGDVEMYKLVGSELLNLKGNPVTDNYLEQVKMRILSGDSELPKEQGWW